MPTFTIRDISDAAAQAIKERAAAAGLSTEAYVRQWIEQQRESPIVKSRYTLKATDDNGARAHIRRDMLDSERSGIVGRGLNNATQEQATAYKDAIALVERNGPGDRERAIALLAAVFADVFETA